MRENYDHFRQKYDTRNSESEDDIKVLSGKIKTLELNLNIRDKEYENLRIEFTRLKKEYEKATMQNYSSNSDNSGIIDKLRSKTLLLIQKLEVLVNEISKTEKTSEGTVNLLKRWVDSIPNAEASQLHHVINKFKSLNF